MSTTLAVGSRVRVKDTYLDEERTEPFVGTVRGKIGAFYIVIFDHTDRWLPPGGEFDPARLELER